MGLILRLKFWLAMGAIVLAGVGLLAMGVLSGGKNAKLAGEIETKLDNLEGKPEIRNELWAKQEKVLAASYKQQLDELQSELAGPDEQLEEPFRMGDAEVPLDFGLWRKVYPDKATELRTRLDEAVAPGAGNLLPLHNVGNVRMSREAMAKWEKEYHLLNVLVSIIERTNSGQRRVRVLNAVGLDHNPGTPLRDEHEKSFAIHGFTIAAVMHFMDIPILLDQILADPLQPEILSISVSVNDRVSVGAQSIVADSPDGMSDAAGMSAPPPTGPTLSVRIKGYIPDYKDPEDEKEKEEEAAGARGGRARRGRPRRGGG